MNARRLDITPAQYLADPCEVPSLSSSIAHTIVSQSPAHAWAKHPRLGGEAPDVTDSMDRGSLIHELVLGKGSGIEVIDAESFRTKAVREAREAARAKGKTPVLADAYTDAIATAGLLQERLADFGIVFNGESEVCTEFEEQGLKGPVICRRMTDHIDVEAGRIIELKTISSADVRTCSRHSVFYGYGIGHAADVSAATKLYPDLAGRIDYIFAFCETEPPYSVTPLRPDGALKDLGESQWLRAVQIWQDCLQANDWPHFVTKIETLETPSWAIEAEEYAHSNL